MNPPQSCVKGDKAIRAGTSLIKTELKEDKMT